MVPGTADCIGLYFLAIAATGSLFESISVYVKLVININISATFACFLKIFFFFYQTPKINLLNNALINADFPTLAAP